MFIICIQFLEIALNQISSRIHGLAIAASEFLKKEEERKKWSNKLRSVFIESELIVIEREEQK